MNWYNRLIRDSKFIWNHSDSTIVANINSSLTEYLHAKLWLESQKKQKTELYMTANIYELESAFRSKEKGG